MCKRATSGKGGKKHFACFNCRKCFKQPGSAEWQAPEDNRPFPCPQCGQPMTDLRADFKAPRQRDVRQWLKVEVLASFGVTYRPGCCGGPGQRPAELREVEEFLVGQGHQRKRVRQRIETARQVRRSQKESRRTIRRT
jgi:hypothetical protein